VGVAVGDTASKIFDEKESTKLGLKIARPVTKIMIRSEEGRIMGIKPVLVSLLISKVSLPPIDLTGMLRPMHRMVHLVEDTEGISGLMVSEVGPTMFLLGIVVSIQRERDTTAIKGLKTTTDQKEAETPTLKNMESVQIAALRNVGFNMIVEGFK
jgi:hypothetical protein